MYLPLLSASRRSRSSVTAFGGYDHTAACGEAEFYEEQNLSSRQYPALCPRLPRTRAATLSAPHGLYAKNGLIWVDGTRLFYNGQDVGAVADSDKVFCGIGSKVLIWPDKVYLDTADQTLHPLGARWEAAGNVSFSPAREDGTAYTVKTTGPTPPEEPENGDYWLDTGGTGDVLRVYSSASESWNAVATTYLRIGAAGIGENFARYDTVTVSGVSGGLLGESTAAALNTDLTVWDCGADYLTVTGLLDRTVLQTPEDGTITVERRIPNLDYLTESDNRVWGCSSADHAIYACRLGDPTNWFSYIGTAADSYTVSVGSDGPFTGAATCMGYVLLFKENLVHKIYGTKPANYQVTTVACRGVRPGASASLALAGETLYYLSADGVMQYDGSLPACISAAFGPVRYVAGAAGAGPGECRFSLQDAAGGWHLFCYDTVRRIWHREDDTHALAFAAAGQTLYWLSADGGLWAAGTEQDPYAGSTGQEPGVEWSGTTGAIGLYTADHKFVSRLELRLEAQAGASLRLEAQYEDAGGWETLAAWTPAPRRSLLVPVVPRRSRWLRLRLSGSGEVVLYSLTRIIEQGSEL